MAGIPSGEAICWQCIIRLYFAVLPLRLLPIGQQKMVRQSSVVLVLAIWSQCIAAEHWPDFRGPTLDGITNATDVPIRWSESNNIAWKTAVPGRGWSTPVITGPLLWMSSAEQEGHQLFAIAIDCKTGKIKHRILLFEIQNMEASNALNSYASPSPVTDGQRVYFSFGTYGVAAVDARDGTKAWSRQDVNLDHQEGPGSSPLLCKNRLVLHCDGRDQQYVLALDTATGKTVWRCKRSLDLSEVGDFARKAFTTALLVQLKGQDRVISAAAQGCYCYDPATGREIWSLRYPGFSAVPRPVASSEVAFVVDGFANPSITAVELDGKGDITLSGVKWVFQRSGPATTSPVRIFNQLVFVTDNGVLTSLDEETGELNWKKRIGGDFCSSPIVVGDLIYLFDRTGGSSVVRIAAKGGDPKVIATNRLDEGMMASPIAVGKTLYLRTKQHLYCVSEKN